VKLVIALEPLIAAQAKARQSAGGKNKVVQNSSQPPDERKTRTELAKRAGVSHDTVSKVVKITTKGGCRRKGFLFVMTLARCSR
jgi:hypothetical protein